MTKDATIRCVSCGKSFIREHRPGRPSSRCEGCRGVRHGRLSVAQVVDSPYGPIATAALAELTLFDRAASASGVVAMAIAEMLDLGGQTGTQTVSLAKELRASIQSAISGATPVGDSLDEMARARARRVGQ